MLAKDVMSKKPEFLPPTATLKKAADQMYAHDYGFIPVGENDRLIGAVTDRDITVRAIAAGKDPNTTTLKDVMSKGIHVCQETDDIEKVAQKMEDLQIRRLVVLNKDKRMIGIISLGDIATKAKNPKLCSELTSAVSQE
jgi:CBS domain-containing protein